jgi:hypothetical protein
VPSTTTYSTEEKGSPTDHIGDDSPRRAASKASRSGGESEPGESLSASATSASFTADRSSVALPEQPLPKPKQPAVATARPVERRARRYTGAVRTPAAIGFGSDRIEDRR